MGTFWACKYHVRAARSIAKVRLACKFVACIRYTKVRYAHLNISNYFIHFQEFCFAKFLICFLNLSVPGFAATNRRVTSSLFKSTVSVRKIPFLSLCLDFLLQHLSNETHNLNLKNQKGASVFQQAIHPVIRNYSR